LFSIVYFLINLPKNTLFTKSLINFTYLIFSLGLIILFFENFYLAATIFVVAIIFMIIFKSKKHTFNLKELDMNLNIILFIFITYFSLISLRNFNDTNLRYLFPIFLFIFPFGLKLISKIIISNNFRTFLVIFSLISAIQPMFLNNLITVNIYPNLGFNNDDYQNISRSWLSSCHNLIKDVYLNYNFLIERNKEFNTIIATGQKFPISIFDKNKVYFTTIDKSTNITTQFFNKYNSNILIISEEHVDFDKNNIYQIDLKNYEIPNTIHDSYYIINLFGGESC
jgi:hypothetical protein